MPEQGKRGWSRREFLRVTALAAGTTMLAACVTPSPGAGSAAPASSSPKVVKFSRYSAFTGLEKIYKDLFSAWEAQHPGATVQAEYAGGNEYWTRLQTEIAAGTTPDVGIAD